MNLNTGNEVLPVLREKRSSLYTQSLYMCLFETGYGSMFYTYAVVEISKALYKHQMFYQSMTATACVHTEVGLWNEKRFRYIVSMINSNTIRTSSSFSKN